MEPLCPRVAVSNCPSMSLDQSLGVAQVGPVEVGESFVEVGRLTGRRLRFRCCPRKRRQSRGRLVRDQPWRCREPVCRCRDASDHVFRRLSETSGCHLRRIVGPDRRLLASREIAVFPDRAWAESWTRRYAVRPSQSEYLLDMRYRCRYNFARCSSSPPSSPPERQHRPVDPLEVPADLRLVAEVSATDRVSEVIEQDGVGRIGEGRTALRRGPDGPRGVGRPAGEWQAGRASLATSRRGSVEAGSHAHPGQLGVEMPGPVALAEADGAGEGVEQVAENRVVATLGTSQRN